MMDIASVRAYLLGLQARIIDTMQAEDGKAFISDGWTREPGGRLEGDGLSRLVEEGKLLERGGCNFSHVKGKALPPSATQHRPELAGAPFEALGVSLVFHPRNPYVPTVHMNVRMFAALPEGREPVAWFGGGMDLTPYYGFEEDAAHFHRVNRDALAPFGDDKYPRFKTWCDEYFFLKHRNEPRGIGGVFFDDFAELGFERSFAHDACGGRRLPRRLPADRAAPPRHALRRARARLPGLPARPLRRVQPGVRPRHAVRPAVGRAHREHPDVDAADREVALRLARPSPARRRRGCTATSCVRATGPTGNLLDAPGCATHWSLRRQLRPVHNAHVALATLALRELALDELRWIPAGEPWQKARVITPAAHREAMVRLAIGGEPRFALERCEIQRRGPSYTLDTVRELQAARAGRVVVPDHRAGPVRRPAHLARLARAARPGHAGRGQPAGSRRRPPHCRRARRSAPGGAAADVDIASTDIRARVAAGLDIAALVPAGVARYIEAHHLYQRPNALRAETGAEWTSANCNAPSSMVWKT